MPLFGAIAGAKIQHAAQLDIAHKQAGFQAMMSNTAYQRAMADMRAAGLNPMLAYQQGGASTPPGAGGSMAFPNMDFGGLVSTALEVRRHKQEYKNLQSQQGLLDEQALTEGTKQDAYRNQAARDVATAEQARAAARKADVEAEILRQSVPGARQEAEIDRQMGYYTRRMKRISDSVDPMISAVLGFGTAAGLRKLRSMSAKGKGAEKALDASQTKGYHTGDLEVHRKPRSRRKNPRKGY